MKTRFAILMVGLLCLTIFLSCDEDDPVKPKKNTDVYPDLTERDDVFEYFSLAYNHLNESRYPKLLDEDFTYRFGDRDYSSGATPQSWNRSDEISAINNLLGGHNHTIFGRVIQVSLTLQPQGTIWTEIPKNDPPYSGETWYQKAFRYWLTVTTTSGREFRALDFNAFFIIRQTEYQGKNIYRIVQWNDDIITRLNLHAEPQPAENTSWGQIKVLYE